MFVKKTDVYLPSLINHAIVADKFGEWYNTYKRVVQNKNGISHLRGAVDLKKGHKRGKHFKNIKKLSILIKKLKAQSANKPTVL